MTMLKLKSDMSPVSAAMFSVSVAGTIAVKNSAISGIRAALFSHMWLPKFITYSTSINTTSF